MELFQRTRFLYCNIRREKKDAEMFDVSKYNK